MQRTGRAVRAGRDRVPEHEAQDLVRLSDDGRGVVLVQPRHPPLCPASAWVRVGAFTGAIEDGDLRLVDRTLVVRRQLPPSARRALRDAPAAVRVDDVRFLDRQQALVEVTVRVDGADARSFSGRAVLTEGS